MPRVDKECRGRCSGCNKSAEGAPLLECLACIRHACGQDQAFCYGKCFQKHWASHKGRIPGVSTPLRNSQDSSSSSLYSPALRATSQPFTPSPSLDRSHRETPQRGHSRALNFPSMGSPLATCFSSPQQHGQYPILATGPGYLRH